MMWERPPSRSRRLEAGRVYLRAPKMSDYRAWKTSRERSYDHLQPFEPRWHEDANSLASWRLRMSAWRKGWRSGRTYAFLVWHTQTDALLGGVALSNVRRGATQTGTLGYWLDVEATGQGFMRAAVERTIKFANEELGLKRIDASTLPENTRSRSLLEHHGFELEGEAKSFLQIAGDRRTHVLYGLVL